MKKSLFLLIVAIVATLTSCTTSRSTVATNANLSHYRYVSVINDDTYRIPPQLMEYQIQLYDAIEQTGLELVNEMNIYNLTPAQKNDLLLAQFSVDASQEGGTVVIVNFIDFNTGRPIVSCRGAYALGITTAVDIRKAIENVSQQISKTFQR